MERVMIAKDNTTAGLKVGEIAIGKVDRTVYMITSIKSHNRVMSLTVWPDGGLSHVEGYFDAATYQKCCTKVR
jgi:hypothetical protein